MSVLKVCNFVTEKDVNLFEIIRKIRRKYLHLWSQSHSELPKDAIDCFVSAAELVKLGLGLNIDNGKVILKSSIMNHIKKQSNNKAD